MESWNYHGVQGNHEALLGFVGLCRDQGIKRSSGVQKASQAEPLKNDMR